MPPKKTTTKKKVAPVTTTTRTRVTKATVVTKSTPKKPGSLVRAVGPAIPLAIAMLGGSVLNTVKPTVPGPPPAPPGIQQPGKFTPACDLPFNGVRNADSDDHCGLYGGKPDPDSQAESAAKNNFCVPSANPDEYTYEKLIDLQKQSADIPTHVDDRKDIENLGEGSYVSYVAWIMKAHYSDVGAGEAVNCNLPSKTQNDIHIVLMPDNKDTNECNSTTAEMSPHYRPPGWTPDILTKLGKPVRIRGQLFYDNSHKPCTPGHTPNPHRASLWEIHPVYSIDVCKSSDIDECRKNSKNDAEWAPVQ